MPIVFPVVGFRQHGKSVYLASLLNEFDRLVGHHSFSYTALDENALQTVIKKQRSLKEGRLPDATPGNVFPTPVILELDGMEELNAFRLLTFDIGGEVFDDIGKLKQYAGYVSRVHSVVWLISLEDLDHSNFGKSPSNLEELIFNYVKAVLDRGGQPKKQALLIVLTKGDYLIEKSGVPDTLRGFLKGERPRPEESLSGFSDELSDVIENWLDTRPGYQNFVRNVRKEFEQVRYCAVSAIGSEPKGQMLQIEVTPRGVLEPLRWLIRMACARQKLHDKLLVIERSFTKRKELIDRHLGTPTSSSLKEKISSAKKAIEIGSMKEATEGVQSARSTLRANLRRVILKLGLRYLLLLLLVSLVAAVIRLVGWKLYRWRKSRDPREHLDTMMLEGGNIDLPAGEYLLTRTLRLDKSLSLKGAGKDTTKIICRDASSGLVFASEGEFKASDLTFEYLGKQPGNVISIQSGKSDLQRCRLTGGTADKTRPDLGHGLDLRGRAAATILECEFVRNGQHGVAVSDMAQVTITDCSIQQNKGAGIFFTSSASGTLQKNDCHNNQSFGIQIGEQASPILEANTCRNNGRSGVGYQGNAAGSAHDNNCLSNGWNGISIEGFAQPTLQNNKCQGNERSGIAFTDNASGTARQNRCEKNAWHGIVITNNASPGLEENISLNNSRSGIFYSADAGGVATKNECTKNRMHGFSVEGRARPNLDANTSTENEICGICYLSRSAGAARGNNVSRNSSHGIIVRDQAKPELDSNRCEQNRGSGIAYFDYAAGIARKNHCTANGANGILVAGNADPALEGNECSNNTSLDVMDWRESTDVMEEERPRLVSPSPPD
jgi:parallel beta-helix repeat protein